MIEALTNGASNLLPSTPVFGNQPEYDQGANTIGPLADEAAVQAVAGRLTAGLGCLANVGGKVGRAVGPGLKALQLGLAGKGAYDSLQGLNTALANGDSVGAAKSLLGLAGAIYGLFGGGCFGAGTPILTPEGSKLIETIQAGDWVMAAPDDDPHAEPVPRQVEEIFENYLPTLDLHVNGRIIRTTAEHPFWVRGHGWIDAHQLEPGDLLRTLRRGLAGSRADRRPVARCDGLQHVRGGISYVLRWSPGMGVCRLGA